jgi:hypothetical protein
MRHKPHQLLHTNGGRLLEGGAQQMQQGVPVLAQATEEGVRYALPQA